MQKASNDFFLSSNPLESNSHLHVETVQNVCEPELMQQAFEKYFIECTRRPLCYTLNFINIVLLIHLERIFVGKIGCCGYVNAGIHFDIC